MVNNEDLLRMGIQGAGAPTPASPVGPASGTSAGADVRGAEFTRILEELMKTAGHLDAKAAPEQLSDPQELKDAVAEAKQSLDAALSLGDDLLEAYRKTLITSPEQNTNQNPPSP